MRKKIIKFIGFSGSGKTTLIEKIVKKLSNDGIRVATVKHDVHGLEIDKEGKDSYKYSEAGAKVSVVSSPEMTVYKLHEKLSLNTILSKIDNVDIIIIEGYSNDEGHPCICVARKDTGKGFKNDFVGYDSVVSDYSEDELKKLGFSGKSFCFDDINEIIGYIMDT